MGSVDPLRISFDEERHAVALAQQLNGVSDIDLHAERDRWVVSLRARHTNNLTNNLVARVLEAVRRSLTGEPTATALVTLDGHEYHLQGESATTNCARERAGSTSPPRSGTSG